MRVCQNNKAVRWRLSAWIRTQQSRPLNKIADRLRTNHLCSEHLMHNTMASASMRNAEAKDKEIAFFLYNRPEIVYHNSWLPSIPLIQKYDNEKKKKKREKLRLDFHSLGENNLASCKLCDISATLSNLKTSHNDKPLWIVIWFVTAIIAMCCNIKSTCCLLVLCIWLRQTMIFKFKALCQGPGPGSLVCLVTV